jgi:dienelactone hydrolase
MCANAEIQTEEITYSGGDAEMKGFLAYDDATEGPRPGVLVVHEWWGHNPYARKRARMLAELGYTALAVDMYGDGKLAEHPQDAGKFSSAVMSNLDSAKARFLAAMKQLQAHSTTVPAKKGAVKAALLVCHGADDPFIPKEQIAGLKKEMSDAGADLTFIAYEGAVHSFTNPDADKFGKDFELPLAYNKDADETSWADMQKFFKKIF